VMVRKTDGSPAVRLGEGAVVSMSRDKRWVLGVLLTVPQRFMLYPTGAGESRELKWPTLETINSVRFIPDGRSFFVCGTEHGKAPRCYLSPLDKAVLEPVTPDSVGGGLLRPDGAAVAVGRAGQVWIYPLAGGAPRLVPGLNSANVVRWSADGTALWLLTPENRLEAADVVSGRRSTLSNLALPSDRPITNVFGLTVADDPAVYAYGFTSSRSLLFTIQGVR